MNYPNWLNWLKLTIWTDLLKQTTQLFLLKLIFQKLQILFQVLHLD